MIYLKEELFTLSGTLSELLEQKVIGARPAKRFHCHGGGRSVWSPRLSCLKKKVLSGPFNSERIIMTDAAGAEWWGPSRGDRLFQGRWRREGEGEGVNLKE